MEGVNKICEMRDPESERSNSMRWSCMETTFGDPADDQSSSKKNPKSN